MVNSYICVKIEMPGHNVTQLWSNDCYHTNEWHQCPHYCHSSTRSEILSRYFGILNLEIYEHGKNFIHKQIDWNLFDFICPGLESIDISNLLVTFSFPPTVLRFCKIF